MPDSLEDSEAVFVEPVAAALRIQDQLVLLPETRIGVLGAGKLVTLIALTLWAERVQAYILLKIFAAS